MDLLAAQQSYVLQATFLLLAKTASHLLCSQSSTQPSGLLTFSWWHHFFFPTEKKKIFYHPSSTKNIKLQLLEAHITLPPPHPMVNGPSPIYLRQPLPLHMVPASSLLKASFWQLSAHLHDHIFPLDWSILINILMGRNNSHHLKKKSLTLHSQPFMSPFVC